MIQSYSFGRMVVAGTTYTTDLKIIRGRIVPDWWRKSGHRVELADLYDILAARPDCLVLGTGGSGLMQVPEQVQVHLKGLGVKLISEPTAQALLSFNKLYGSGKNIAAGFHLTC